MKISRCFIAALAAATFFGAEASADELTFVEDIPAEILFGTVAEATGEASENPQGSANSQAAFGFRNLDADGEEGTRTRGQSFTFATGDGLAHAIGSLSVSLNNPISNGFRPDGQLQLTIFEWDSSDPDNFASWDSGTGGEFESGHVELYNETFPVPATAPLATGVGNQLLAQISFDPGQLELVDGTTYGFLFRYTLDSFVDDVGEPLSADVSFAFDARQDNNLPGALLSTNQAVGFAAADNAQSTSRDMNFFFTSGDGFLLGDVNLDGTVDFLDISPFIVLLSTGMLQAEADIDGNGAVDFLDISPFIVILSGG